VERGGLDAPASPAGDRGGLEPDIYVLEPIGIGICVTWAKIENNWCNWCARWPVLPGRLANADNRVIRRRTLAVLCRRHYCCCCCNPRFPRVSRGF
jgi:hypothetical protein